MNALVHSLFTCLLIMPLMFLRAQPADSFPAHVIVNDRVRMKLYLPDPEEGAYRATRFDWSGIIASATWQGHEYFGYWKDSRDPTFHEDLTGPAEGYWKPGLGYEEARPGEGFVRIGVGVLEKPDEKAYRMFATYPILDHGSWAVDKGKEHITFTHTLQTEFGYAYVYTKTVRLLNDEPGFVIAHRLQNTGSKTIATDQFNHNFFMIDGEPTGPAMQVSFPFELQTDSDTKDIVRIEGSTLAFNRPFAEKESVFLELKGFGETAVDHGFTIVNTRSGAGVRMRMDRPVYRMAYWSIDRTLCPENGLWIEAEPGETFTWDATYVFFEE